jgi:hypothetical protein
MFLLNHIITAKIWGGSDEAEGKARGAHRKPLAEVIL